MEVSHAISSESEYISDAHKKYVANGAIPVNKTSAVNKPHANSASEFPAASKGTYESEDEDNNNVNRTEPLLVKVVAQVVSDSSPKQENGDFKDYAALRDQLKDELEEESDGVPMAVPAEAVSGRTSSSPRRKDGIKKNVKLYKPHRTHPVQLPPVTVELQKQPAKETRRTKSLIEAPLKEPYGESPTPPKKPPAKTDDEAEKGSKESSGEVSDTESQGFWCLRYSRKQQLTLFSLCLVDFTSFLGMSIMAPFFPMEAAAKGMDEATVGFVFSTYALVMFIASPIFGYILPKVGSKFMFLSGLFLAAGCTVLFGVLDEFDDVTFLPFCFIIRSFEALGAAAYSTASCTIVAEMFPDNIGAVFGLLETFVGLGSSVGPAIGGALYAVGGFKLPFILLGVFMIIMVPVNIFMLPVQDVLTHVKPGSTIRLLQLPTVVIMCLVVVVQASAWAFLDPFLEPHLREFELNTETVGLIFLMLSSTYALFCPLWGWVSDRCDRTSCMMVVGMFITAVSLLFLGPSQLLPFLENELWLNIVSLLVMGIAMALAIIPTFHSMMEYAIDSGFNDDISTYSLISGTWSAAYSLGDFIGPSVGGIMVSDFDFATSATGIAGFIVAVALILIIYETVQWCNRKPSVSTTIKKLSVSDLSEISPLLKTL